MEKQTIGKFIAALRKVNGMTQSDLAERLGVTNKSVSKWERDECCPDLTLIPVIAEIFGVTSDEILKGARIASTEGAVASEPIKTEKQTSMLIQKRLMNFKHLSLIPIFLTVTNLIALFVFVLTAGVQLSLNTHLPEAVRAFNNTFLIVSLAGFLPAAMLSIGLEYVFQGRAKAALFSLDTEAVFDKRLLGAAKTIENYFFNIIAVNLIALLNAALFLMIIFSLNNIDGIVDFSHFAFVMYFLWFSLPAYVYACFVKRLVTDKKYYDIRGQPEIKRNLKKLNIFAFAASAGALMLSLSYFISLIIFISSTGSYMGLIGFLIFVIVYFSFVGASIVTIILRKKILKPYGKL